VPAADVGDRGTGQQLGLPVQRRNHPLTRFAT
jgi:hypothetical protein